ncbi:MAG: HAMP domain-containing protein [Myxococcaceae bacterium]|nr:HAMP domain-containing protein [Myxococcaceae bacterium]
MIRTTLRTQLVLLLSAMLVLAMGTFLWLATRVISADKLASVYDVNALLAGAVSAQVEAGLDALADKLRYFGTEHALTEPGLERKSRALFDADDDLLALEVWREEAGTWKRRFTFTDDARLAALNLSAADIEKARAATPVPLAAVLAQGILVQNASQPPDLALVRLSAAVPREGLVVTAELRPERLLSVVGASGLYRVFLVDGDGRVLAHAQPEKVLSHEDVSSNPVVRDALDAKVARGTREYTAEGGDVVASWARLERAGISVVVEAPRREVFRAVKELSQKSALFAAAVLSLAVIAAVFFARRVVAPLRTLQATMDRVSRGELGVEVPVGTRDEVGAVAEAFNLMSRELQRRSDELDVRNAQLVQSEKLSAIGELSAGLAHEVKNPMVGIVGFSQLGLESTSMDEAKEYFRLIDSDAQRANGILQRLLDFARPPDVEREHLDLNEVVDASLKLCAHQMQLAGVKVHTSLAQGLPGIEGNSNQLRQVLLNLMMNAAQAMESSTERKLTVETLADPPDGVVVLVKDTGPGIAPEVRDRLFQPFVTSKPRGKGTGLGLSVSRSIIQEHEGELSVLSEPGFGATFVIRLTTRPLPKKPSRPSGPVPIV